MHSILEIILAVALGAMGYFLTNFWFAPVLRFRALRERIQANQIYYGNILNNPGCDQDGCLEASDMLRKDAAELRALNATLIELPVFRAIARVPRAAKLNEANGCLVGMSNGVFRRRSGNLSFDTIAFLKRVKTIQECLEIEIEKDVDEELKLATTEYEMARAYYRPRAANSSGTEGNVPSGKSRIDEK